MDSTDLLILKIIDSGEPHATGLAAEQLGLSRQSIAARLRRLTEQKLISPTGIGRGRRYRLLPATSLHKTYTREALDEFRVWQTDIAPLLAGLPENVIDIWRYGITEMVNNAVDHSEGLEVIVRVERTALGTTVSVIDNGEGIFHRIQRLLGFYDPREAILELAKGKLTTDPGRHSGEGVFFSSRVFDQFSILSRNLFFSHDSSRDDWLVDGEEDSPGTIVRMRLANDSARTTREVFDRFAEPDEYTFVRTIVPVRLAQHEGEKLVSRAQAKRLTMRFDRFKTVVLDFAAVAEIGQAFSDEIFRVFQSVHPEVAMLPINMSHAVEAMVRRAKAGVSAV